MVASLSEVRSAFVLAVVILQLWGLHLETTPKWIRPRSPVPEAALGNLSGERSRPYRARRYACAGDNFTAAETSKVKSQFSENPRCPRGKPQMDSATPIALGIWGVMWRKITALPRLAQRLR